MLLLKKTIVHLDIEMLKLRVMRAKRVNQQIKTYDNIPTYDELYDLAPQEIKDYIDKCNDTPQGTDWHPEGCVGIHNKLVYDRARESGDLNLAIAAFFHDLGKVDTTAPNKKGGWSAHGHERVSARLADKYKQWIGSIGGKSAKVKEIVSQHMRIKQMDGMRPAKQQVMKDNPYYRELQQFTKFDDMRTLTNDELNRYK